MHFRLNVLWNCCDMLRDEYTLTYLLTYLLTPWCRVLLEKLTGLQLVKKFPAFHGTRRFITALTSVRHLSLSWISSIHLLEIHPNIIHPSTPRSPQWSLSLRFPHQDPIRPPLLTHTRHMPSPSHSSRFYHPYSIGWDVYSLRNLLSLHVSLPNPSTYLPFSHARHIPCSSLPPSCNKSP